jgi:TPR repeat protein
MPQYHSEAARHSLKMRRGSAARSAEGDYDGMRPYTGDTVPQDHSEAGTLRTLGAMRRESAARSAECDYDSGMRSYTGDTVPQDHSEAARLFRLAANQGHAQAQWTLAQCYSKGEGVPQDHSEAARLLRLAADQGHGAAQYNCGLYSALPLSSGG